MWECNNCETENEDFEDVCCTCGSNKTEGPSENLSEINKEQQLSIQESKTSGKEKTTWIDKTLAEEETIVAEVKEQFMENETYIGHFGATSHPSVGMRIAIGNIANYGMKTYYITLTDKRIFLSRIRAIRKHSAAETFEYSQLRRTKVKGGQKSKKFDLIAGNKKLRFRDVIFTLEKIDGILTPDLLSFLERKIALV
jgi:hypothetical protein